MTSRSADGLRAGRRLRRWAGRLLLGAGLAAPGLAGADVLSATGYGPSVEEAEQRALAALGQQIAVDVDSVTQTAVRGDGGSYEEHFEEQIAAEASSYFQGVALSDPQAHKAGYKVEARLTERGVEQTLDHFLVELDRTYSALSPEELEEAVDQAHFALALEALAPGQRPESFRAQVRAYRRKAQQQLEMGRVIFDVEPQEAQVELEGEAVAAREPIMLEPGTYRYEADAQGYRPESGRVQLAAQSEREVRLRLVPELKGTVRLEGEGRARAALEEAREVLVDHDIQMDDTASGRLRFELGRKELAEVAGERYYRLKGRVQGYAGSSLALSRSATIDRVAESQLQERERDVIKALSRAALQEDGMREVLD